jgi:hypothetical protein
MAEYTDYAWLVSDDAAPWLARAAADARPALRQLQGLRKDLSAERARLVVEQVELRRRGRTKFGEVAARMFFTPVHLEQATDRWIGQYKASRFVSAAPAGSVLHDYCCGIGGDLLWLAQQAAAIGYDFSDVACLFAAANLQAFGVEALIRQADVTEHAPDPDDAWHIDPDRRIARSRTTAIDRYSPGPEVVDAWLKRAPHGAVKLAPAAVVPAAWAATAELQWITTHRECRQQVAWFGALAVSPGSRRATVIVDHNGEHAVQGDFTGAPDVPLKTVGEPRGYLFDPDSSLLAAGLLGALALRHNLHSLGPGSAYLTSDQPIAEPLLQSFAVIDALPAKPADVARYLSARSVGRVEIKKRGVTIDPENLRRSLRLRGDHEATLVLTRIAKREVALICQRLPVAAGVTEPRPFS